MSERTFEETVVHALQNGGVDVSLSELIFSCELPESELLGSALDVVERINRFQLELVPNIRQGSLETRRVLRPKVQPVLPDISSILAKYDESSGLEFKSSMVCDIKRHAVQAQYHRSDAVIHSLLKTICAFANDAGGEILVGVADDKSIVGLEPDYNCGVGTRDRWQLEFSSLVKGRIFDGASVDPYIRVMFLSVNGKDVAHVRVLQRRDLTFLKSEDGKRYEYYVRSGNKTEQVLIEAFEEHIIRKRGFAI